MVLKILLQKLCFRSCRSRPPTVLSLLVSRPLTMPPKRKVKDVTESVTEEPKVKKTKKVKEVSDDVKDDAPKGKTKKQKDEANKAKKGEAREKIPDVGSLDFSSNATDKKGNKWNWKFSSWNINGIRAWLDKNAHSYISHEAPDIFCVQETKCETEKIPKDVEVPGYKVFWLSGDKEGYSGTGLYSKQQPLNVTYGIGEAEHDKEGRVITAEYEDFYFVTAYIPNSGRGLVRLDYRTKEWDPAFRKYIKGLDDKKPVILCGDLNVAHTEIDLAKPKGNKKTAGFTEEERDNFSQLLNEGFIDSFRHLYPDVTDKYSYWTYMMNCRAKNVGWRLDYFVVSEKLKESVCDSLMRTGVMGSDHCPVVCLMHLPKKQ